MEDGLVAASGAGASRISANLDCGQAVRRASELPLGQQRPIAPERASSADVAL